MKIIHRYIARTFSINLTAALIVLLLLFITVDVLDRIDNILSESASLLTVLSYFSLKIPLMFISILPIATLAGTLFTIGLMSKNSEITAMRAAGLTIFWLVRPIMLISLLLSITSLILAQTVVPYATRRVKEIYNIDIKKKDKTGSFSQADFWWRDAQHFYSAKMFDSRTNTLHNLTRLTLNDKMLVDERLDAKITEFLDPQIGWNMHQVEHYFFDTTQSYPYKVDHPDLPLPLNWTPDQFYSVSPEPDTMSFSELRKFMRDQQANGISTAEYLADLYEKLSFPLITLVVTFVTITFSLQSARTGSMALPILISLAIAFSYYAIHSFSIALGRAELLNPLVSAWFANGLYAALGTLLMLGSESAS